MLPKIANAIETEISIPLTPLTMRFNSLLRPIREECLLTDKRKYDSLRSGKFEIEWCPAVKMAGYVEGSLR
jgi:hypothetical protein